MLFIFFTVSECLQYPDFSVVVLYRKVVIGFGFMVPDIKFNEAYISFLFVHPEWRDAGIGTFMVYHLIQVRVDIVTLKKKKSTFFCSIFSKDTGHDFQVLNIIVSIKTYFVTSNGELVMVLKHVEKRLPLK